MRVLWTTAEPGERLDKAATASMRACSSGASLTIPAMPSSCHGVRGFVERVKAGLADADAGRYATEADFERLRTKYRPA
jgi:predicted transcriptional regulator